MPAPAVIPALVVYINIVVFKTFVANLRIIEFCSESGEWLISKVNFEGDLLSSTSVFLPLLQRELDLKQSLIVNGLGIVGRILWFDTRL